MGFDLVLKFGGTSVGSAESIQQVIQILTSLWKENKKFIVVVSALSGTTDRLIELCHLAENRKEEYKDILQQLEKRHFDVATAVVEPLKREATLAALKPLFEELTELAKSIFILGEASHRTIDLVTSFGERFSAIIVSQAMKTHVDSAEFVDARDLIKTDDVFGSAHVDFQKTNENLVRFFQQHGSTLPVVTGFLGSTSDGITTTLEKNSIGRGGSDYTASIVGAALAVQEIQIWTDVDGVLSADPRKVKSAVLVSQMSYDEAMELSYFGAKVIYAPTMAPALEKNIPLRIKNTFNPLGGGTLVCHDPLSTNGIKITSIEKIALLNVQGSGMVGVAGISQRLFGALARHGISVILISQASSEHSICFVVETKFSSLAKRVVEKEFELEMLRHQIDSVQLDLDVAIIAVVGENMHKRIGAAGIVFSALGSNGVNVIAIAQGSSELNISLVVKLDDCNRALRSIHDAFYNKFEVVHVFLVGCGLIGKELLRQIHAQSATLVKEHGALVKVVGLANSRKMLVNENGLALDTAADQLEKASQSSLEAFVAQALRLRLPNSVFVDCTASSATADHYQQILQSGMHIVAANKKPFASSPFTTYRAWKQVARTNKVALLHETTVGAALPVISTLKNLVRTGDKILQIEAVLSGTLSYVFNTFNAAKRFSQVVEEARQKGFTEPDPRDDLNGADVARKLLILARESGLAVEMEDIDLENLVPEQFRQLPLQDFLQQFPEADAQFEAKRKKAEDEGKVLRYVASLKESKCSVRLQAVPLDHPCAALQGSDNIVIFKTTRYNANPLVVKGPGAGAAVTASGVFGDILSIISH